MKKILRAFTLIELLVVVSIITLISVSGVFYFLDFVKEQEINQKLVIIEDDLKGLDTKVKNYEIFDYEIIFDKSNTGTYISYINNFDTTNQTININSSGNGIINPVGTGSGYIKIYKNNKLFLNKIIDKSIPFNYDFNKSQEYKITGTFSGEILNDIIINYFSIDNIHPEKNNNLELIDINTKEDKTGLSLSRLEIINIGGNKKFYEDNIEKIYDDMYIFFENNGTEKFIKISK